MEKERELLLDFAEPSYMQNTVEKIQKNWESNNDILWGSLPTWKQNEIMAKSISDLVQERLTEFNKQQSTGYDLNNGRDCLELLMQFSDGYIPYQIEDFPKDVVDEAIDSVKGDGLELDGNRIYTECTKICNQQLDDTLNSLLENFDDSLFTNEEREIVSEYLESHDEHSVLDSFANGSLDSSIFTNCELSNEDLYALQIIDEKTDIFKNFEDSMNCDIDFSFRDMEFEKEIERE